MMEPQGTVTVGPVTWPDGPCTTRHAVLLGTSRPPGVQQVHTEVDAGVVAAGRAHVPPRVAAVVAVPGDARVHGQAVRGQATKEQALSCTPGVTFGAGRQNVTFAQGGRLALCRAGGVRASTGAAVRFRSASGDHR